MAAQFLYTPILKGKLNEFKALGKIPTNFAQIVMPVIEFLPPKEGESVETAMNRFAGGYKKHCQSQVACIDLHAIKPGDTFLDGSPALEATLSMISNLGIKFLPVHGFDREPELWQRIAKYAATKQSGILFRLERDDIDAADDTILEILQKAKEVGIKSQSIAIIIDLRSIELSNTGEISNLKDEVAAFIEYARSAANFKFVAIAASSMPKTVAGIPKDTMKSIVRKELDIWLPNAQHFDMEICFGDYGIVHPNFSESVQSPHTNAKIRYTRGKYHHVFRGHSLKIGNKYGQYFELSEKVVNHKHYQGRDFSFGDDKIWNCAQRQVGSGNPGTWVEVDTNHHLVYTVYQMQKIFQKHAAGVSFDELVNLVETA